MRRPLVAANWKMYTSLADAHVLAASVSNGVAKLDSVEVVICPPTIWLSEVHQAVRRGSHVKFGVQNIYFESEGAYTGETSPLMAKELAEYAIIGHSERREYFGEKDFDVNEKVVASLRAGLKPIICVGEKKRSGIPKEPFRQLGEALEHVPKKHYKDIVVAYEPVWAIGTGENADPEYVAKVLTYLREHGLAHTPMLYGGSVKAANVEGYARRPEIDGLLVGGASLRASEFITICEKWYHIKHFKD